MMRNIITTMIRPKLEYAGTVWSVPLQEKTCTYIGKDIKDGNRTGRIAISGQIKEDKSVNFGTKKRKRRLNSDL